MTRPVPTNLPPPLPPSGSAGVVLLVEDDDAIRSVVKRGLEMRGITVLAVDSAAEALRAADEYPGRVDVMVTDVLLPGMDGRQLAATVQAERPELKIVFISGYPREEVFGPEATDIRAEFLPKPFTPLRLAEVLAPLLAAARAADPPTPSGANDTVVL